MAQDNHKNTSKNTINNHQSTTQSPHQSTSANTSQDNPTDSLAQVKRDILAELKQRVEDKILEQNNYDLLEKLISKAENIAQAQAISALGTTYKKTGFHFDTRLEKTKGNAIHYLKKDSKLSFENNPNATTHTLIIGDNYPALLNLLISYREKIKVIYIDPPYGKDNLGDFAPTNYNNAITRDNLLSMLKPRLELAKMLLRDDGVIFCSIDDRNQAYLKCLFDDIFGERNFVANLIWQKKKGGSQDSRDFAKEHEYILCYTKKEWEINDDKQAHNECDFTKIINGKKAKILKLEKWGNHSLRTDRPTLYYAIKDPNGKDFYPIAPNGADGCWRKKPENLDNEHIYWQESKGRLTPYEVIYFDEVQENHKIIKTRTIFTEYGTTTDATKEILALFGGNKVFDTPKPVNLIKRLLEISTTPHAAQTGGGGDQPSEDSARELDSIHSTHPIAPSATILQFGEGERHSCHTECSEVSQDCRDFSHSTNAQNDKNGYFANVQNNNNRDISFSTQTQYDDEPDIILDFFAGSGTTAHAVMELNRQDSGNRKCILVTNNEITDINPNGIALDVTTKRLKRIMSGECYDGATNFEWIKKNKPYGDNLCVYRIETISKYAQGNTTHSLAPSATILQFGEGGIHQNHSTNQNLSVLDAIDECAYGLKRFENIHDKAKWIAQNFEITLEKLEEIKSDSECARLEREKLERQAKGE